MYEFRCRDADHPCGWKATAGSEDELKAKIAQHVKERHNVQVTTQTIWNYLKKHIRTR